jgi:hypothetical protein
MRSPTKIRNSNVRTGNDCLRGSVITIDRKNTRPGDGNYMRSAARVNDRDTGSGAKNLRRREITIDASNTRSAADVD